MVMYSAFPGLPIETDKSIRLSRTPRICIASYEIVGPNRNGGIGTAYFSLAEALAHAGYEVTILYLRGNYCEQGSIDDWRSYYRKRRIKFVPLRHDRTPTNATQNMVTAHDAYRWLRGNDFDIVHFPELFGHGYYSITAKRQEIDFSHTAFCIGTHSPISWIRAMNHELLETPDELEFDFMERQCVALADVVVSPSQYMLGWLRSRGWLLPKHCYVQQYILSPESRARRQDRTESCEPAAVREIVFFGRLEERKGLKLFCDALDRVAQSAQPDVEITFLGRPGRVNGRNALPYIEERARQWPFRWQILTDESHADALRFLQREGRIAIIPSLEDNLPNTVIECICAGTPFIASRAGGIPELIRADDLEHATFAPDADALASRLSSVLAAGIRVARPAVDPEENRRQWVLWHSALASQVQSRDTRGVTFVEPAAPMVSVCITHRGPSRSLDRVVASVSEQDWPNFQVILASEKGTTTDCLSAVNGSRRASVASDWQMITGAKGSPGAARNAAATHATGEYLLFMDDDSYARPDEISSFVRVCASSGADILNCFMDVFDGDVEPGSKRQCGRWLFLGGAVGPSVFRNYLGFSNIFLRKAVFQQVGGFAEDCTATWQDWAWLAKAVLMGFRLDVVPTVLAWHRAAPIASDTDDYDTRIRSLQPYVDAVPSVLRDIFQLAVSMKLHLDEGQVFNGSGGIDDLQAAAVLSGVAAGQHRKVASFLDAWFEYRQARSNMPAQRWERVPHIARQLMRGRYHRFAHGFGSALRDLRKPPKARSITMETQVGRIAGEKSPSRMKWRPD